MSVEDTSAVAFCKERKPNYLWKGKDRVVTVLDNCVCIYVCVCVRTYMCMFLGAFAKLRKVTVSFVMPVCPSACKNSAPTGRILMKLDI